MRIFIYIAFLFTICLKTLGQTVAIPDNNLKSCLKTDYPSLLNNNDDLIIAEANTLTGALRCSSKGIINLSGIEHFTSIDTLQFNNNDIVDATLLAELTQLQFINFTSNEMEFTPDFSGFPNLKVFKANYNQFDNPPTFNSGIEHIELGNNSLAGTIDFTNYTALTNLTIFENDVKNINGLESMTSLRLLRAYDNELNIPKDLTNLAQLRRVEIHRNNYTDSPLFPPSIEYLSVGENNLTYDDLTKWSETALFADSFPSFENQTYLAETKNDTAVENASYVWEVNFDDVDENNLFVWLKNGEAFDTNSENTLTWSQISLQDTGIYTCRVINSTPGFENMSFLAASITLSVAESNCFSIENITIETLITDCIDQATLQILGNITGDTTGELSYMFASINDTIQTTEKSVTATRQGEYQLFIYDDVCQLTGPSVSILFDHSNCDPQSFSPDGDGIDDWFFIEETGIAQIYDKTGQLIKHLNVPNSWDGTDDIGKPAKLGYYIVIINQKKYGVTLIR